MDGRRATAVPVLLGPLCGVHAQAGRSWGWASDPRDSLSNSSVPAPWLLLAEVLRSVLQVGRQAARVGSCIP